MAENYRVRIAKEDLVFSAAHFITYDGGTCERLHGHNYQVAAEVYGALDENHYVLDFLLLHAALKTIVDELDHHVLLPTDHPRIRVVPDDDQVRASFADRRWMFPRDDCILLPMPNTTSELLARYIGRRLLSALEERTGRRPARIRIELDDCSGQTALVEMDNR